MVNCMKPGVSRSSSLGPMQFSIYIKDLLNCFGVFKTIMYAECTTLYCDLKPSTHNFVNIINGEL